MQKAAPTFSSRLRPHPGAPVRRAPASFGIFVFSLCSKAIAVSYHVRFSTYGRSMSVPISHTPPMHQPIPFRTAARRMRKRTNKTKRPHSRCGPFFFNVVMMYLPSIHLRRETALFFLVCHRSFFSTPLLSHRNVNFRKQICQIVSKRKCDATMTNGRKIREKSKKPQVDGFRRANLERMRHNMPISAAAPAPRNLNLRHASSS